MFDAAIFWASLGGIGGVLMIVAALFFCMFMSIEENEPVLGLLFGAPVALVGIGGIALSLALTNGWAV